MNPKTSTYPSALFHRSEQLMGNRFAFSIVADGEGYASECLADAVAEVRRIEALLTTFNESSITALINRSAGIEPVAVDEEVYGLIERSLRISSITQGAFDISYGSIDKAFWNFDRNMTALPDAASARSAIRLINYRNIVLDPACRTVFLKETGMRIGFGGIGKGYAAERVKALLKEAGIRSGVVNAAGDLCAWGHRPDGSPWTIGIAAPDGGRHPFAGIALNDMAVATSGDYEKFVEIGGKRYSHTIDPRTGFPAAGIKSVTILCPNAEIADALATPVLVMGIRAGIDLVNQLRDVECLVVDAGDRLHTSDNIKIG